MSLETEFKGLSRDELAQRWQDMVGQAPPPFLGRSTMIRILVCELQWKACHHNRAASIRALKKALGRSTSTMPQMAEGTHLIREWNGQRYTVDVTSEGYVWRGQVWRSLSAIAREITGARWSGPRFFGVTA